MKKEKLIYFVLPILLFLVTPFVQVYSDLDKAEFFNVKTLPPITNTIASAIRWGVVILGCMISLLSLTTNTKNVTKSLIFFSLFYFVQLLYAIVDGFEVDRFFLLTITSFLFPFYLSLCFVKYKNSLLRIFNLLIFGFIILGLVLNGHLVLAGQRFLGFSNNSNLFGFTAIFWLLIVLVNLSSSNSDKKLSWINFLLLSIVILLSGSRNAMIGYVVLNLFYFRNFIKQFLVAITLGAIVFMILNNYIDLSFVTTRLLNVENSISDSGRTIFWNKAFFHINHNLFGGNGMDANIRLIDTGNMHNVYIRFLLNMGLMFTLLSLFQLFLSIFNIFKKRNVLSYLLLGFMFSYLLINFGEDFMVGIGNSAYIYVLYVYGFINYNLIDNDTSR